jgi:cytidine deaminase
MKKGELILEAEKARTLSISPYSKFPVGAAVFTEDGKFFHGANIENSSYPLSMCAERNAIYHALMNGYKPSQLVALAVIGETLEPISPCGACRQVMHELLNPQAQIILANVKGKVREVTVKELLPFAFSPSDLKQ